MLLSNQKLFKKKFKFEIFFVSEIDHWPDCLLMQISINTTFMKMYKINIVLNKVYFLNQCNKTNTFAVHSVWTVTLLERFIKFQIFSFMNTDF